MEPLKPSDIPGKRMRPFDIRDFVLRRSIIIVVMSLILFVCVSPAAFFLRKDYYRAQGTLLISAEVNLLAPPDVRRVYGSFREFALTHAERIKSETSLRRTIEKLPRDQWPQFIPAEVDASGAARIINRQLEVDLVGPSRLLSVAMNGDEPGSLPTIINAVMRGYVEQLEREQELESSRGLSFLTEEKDAVQAEIETLMKRKAELAEVLGSSSFNEMKNPRYERLIECQSAFLKASADALDKQALLDRARNDRNTIGKQDLSVFAREMVATNEAVYMIDNWTYQRLQDLRTGIDGLTADNSDRVYVEERMTAMTQYLDEFKEQMHRTMLSILQEKRDFEFTNEEKRAESAFVAASQLAGTLGTELEHAQAAFAESSAAVSEGIGLNDSLAALQSRRSFLEQRISEVKLDSKAPTHLSVEQMANLPGGPAGDNFTKLLALLLAASFGMVGASTLAFELLDGRIRSRGDVAAALGTMPLEPVPFHYAQNSEQLFEYCVQESPSHICAQSIRRSIVRLNQERERQGARIFLFTGATYGAGVSSLTKNFGAGFEQYVDQVLILTLPHHLEARLEKNADIDEDPVSSVLRTLPEDESWVAHIAYTGASVMVHRRSNLERLLKEARSRFGVILIDAGPLLKSDLAQFAAVQADTVILVGRRGLCAYSDVRKAIEFMVHLRVRAMTAIFNAETEQKLDQLIRMKTRFIEMIIPAWKARIAKYGAGLRFRKMNRPSGTAELAASGANSPQVPHHTGPSFNRRFESPSSQAGGGTQSQTTGESAIQR
jgi:polysaccharide biosynthesis transport protein